MTNTSKWRHGVRTHACVCAHAHTYKHTYTHTHRLRDTNMQVDSSRHTPAHTGHHPRAPVETKSVVRTCTLLSPAPRPPLFFAVGHSALGQSPGQTEIQLHSHPLPLWASHTFPVLCGDAQGVQELGRVGLNHWSGTSNRRPSLKASFPT